MGIWGMALYSNDCTCDVRDTYMKFLKNGLNNEDAYKKTIEELNDYIGSEEEPLFWYSLADTQWNMGRLMPNVKEKALIWIERLGGIELWKDRKKYEDKWKETLSKLKKKLESPLPPEKKIRKPVDFIHNPWNIGDVYAYQFNSMLSKDLGLYGKYIAFQKIENVEWCDGVLCSRVQIYDKIFSKIPNLDSLNGVRILPVDIPERFICNTKPDIPFCLNVVLIRYDKKDYPMKSFTFIGNYPDYERMPIVHPNHSNEDWENLEEWLCLYYQAWCNYQYSINGDNTYVMLKPDCFFNL